MTSECRKPIKYSNKSEYSLVSNKNLRQKIPSSSWRPGPGNLSQNGQKSIPLMRYPTKNKIQNLTIFFNAI